MTTTEPLRILVADEHAPVRRGIQSVLGDKPHWQVCGEATSGHDAVEQARRLRPDVVLLEAAMQELSGFATARRIAAESPDTCILLLTIDEPDAIAEAARRAGARGVVLKYDADDLVESICTLSRPAAGVRVAGKGIGEMRHIGAFFRSPAERLSIVAPFFAEGLKFGERALQLVAGSECAQHLDVLEQAGVDVERATANEQLEIVPWEVLSPRDGRFDRHDTAPAVHALLHACPSRARLFAQMEWPLEHASDPGDILEHEARVNVMRFAEEHVVICAYDLTRFSATFIVDAMRIHPALIVGGAFCANPFYVPSAI